MGQYIWICFFLLAEEYNEKYAWKSCFWDKIKIFFHHLVSRDKNGNCLILIACFEKETGNWKRFPNVEREKTKLMLTRIPWARFTIAIWHMPIVDQSQILGTGIPVTLCMALVMRSAIAMHWFGQRGRSYVFVALFISSHWVDHKVSHKVGLVMLSVTYISHFDQMHQASQVIWFNM